MAFPEGSVHELVSLRGRTSPTDVPDDGRELVRRRRPLGGGARPSLDPVRARALGAVPPPPADVVGRAVWNAADRARRLGSSVALVQDEDADASRPPLNRPLMPACLAGFGLSAIVLFLLCAE